VSANLRNWLIGISLVVFIGGAVTWFIIAAADGGDFDAGQAFLGLAYVAALVFGVLFILFVARYLDNSRNRHTGSAQPASQAAEQRIIVAQLWIGASLIAFGAVLAIVFGVVVEDEGQESISLAIGTAVIGAGAALMPPGAAAGAGARINGDGTGGEAGAGAGGEAGAGAGGEAARP
jgi:hypothetical protein